MIKVFIILTFSLIAGNKVNEKIIIRHLYKYIPQNNKIIIKNLNINKNLTEDSIIEWINPIPPIGIVNFKFYSPTLNQNIIGNTFIFVYGDIAVAKKNIYFKERFNENNIEFVKRCLNNYIGTGYFTNSNEIFELQASSFIRRGSVLGKNNTMSSLLAINGQNVELVKENGSLKLTASMRALQDGKKGDWIFIYNPVTKKTLKAEVIGDGKVRLP